MKPRLLSALTSVLIGSFVANGMGRVGGFCEQHATDVRSDGVSEPKPFPGNISQWNGLARHDFRVDGANVIVVAPAKPLAGRPWVWRGEFFGAFPNADIELVKGGWHLAYINVPNLFGSPRAVARWGKFHEVLVKEHGLHPRPGLIGLSRGALYCMAWAAAYPDKTLAVYLDNGVCDFKSWPGGKVKGLGAGQGSLTEWQNVLTAFGFKNDEEAIAYKGNPVDALAPLARRKIPLLLVYGDSDKVVPHTENSSIVYDRYRSLGGPVERIIKPGGDHHPHGLPDPRPVAAFFERAWSGLHKDDKFPAELVNFVPLRREPILTGAEGQWDALIRERGWVMKDEGQWKMWYTGYDDKKGQRKLGYATSKDGLSWARHPDNPIYQEHWVEDMMIVKDSGKYWMFAEGKDDQAQLLVSEDGIQWRRMGHLDIRMKNGQPIAPGPYGTPTVWKENGVWHLFYERNDLGVWLATSKDLKVWTNVQDEPVMTPGPAEHDKDLIAFNQVIKHHGRYYAYYHGSAKTGPKAKLWSTCVATSTDLVHWEKFAGNPIQPVGQNKSSGIVVHDGERLRLYTMHPQVYVHASAPNER